MPPSLHGSDRFQILVVVPVTLAETFYCKMFLLLDIVFSSGQSNYWYTGLRIPVPSFLNIPEWRVLLCDYEDSVICEFLEFPWPLGYNKQTLPVFNLRTHRGALKFPSVIQDYITSEISLGRIAGPFDALPFPDSFVVSLLNTVAK